MRRVLNGVLTGLALVTMMKVAFAQEDRPGAKDYPGISRMPGYYISGYQEAQFDSYSLRVGQGRAEKQQPVEGHRYFFRYQAGKDAPATTTALQILRNYQNAARAAGGQILFESGDRDDRETTIRLVKGGREVWMAMGTTGHPPSTYVLTIVEKQGMH